VARQAVTGRALLKLNGMADVTANLARVMSKTTGQALKGAYLAGGKEIWGQVQRNIQSLPRSSRAKRILAAEISIMKADPRKPYVVVGMSQHAGIKKLQRPGRFIGNPYWFEFGTSRGMKPTPFFRPAIAQARMKARDAMAEEMKDIFQAAVKP
jgi:HK97 gp10 family phage protein